MVAFGAQVDHRRELAGMQVGQPVGALAQPARLIEQAVADQVAPVQLGIVIPAGVFRCGPARGPQLSQRGIQAVQVHGGGDLVHPRRGEPRRGRQLADRDSLRAGRGQCPAAFPPGLLQAPRRPRHPQQHPPFPPPGGHPVRDRHADTLPLRGEAGQQREDLAIVWPHLDGDRVTEAWHCVACQPYGPVIDVSCSCCGNGPLITGQPPELGARLAAPALDWMHSRGWQLHPQPLCPADHR